MNSTYKENIEDTQFTKEQNIDLTFSFPKNKKTTEKINMLLFFFAFGVECIENGRKLYYI